MMDATSSLPESKEQWEVIKQDFLKAYPKLEDTPETWTFVLSQLQNVKMPDLDFQPHLIYNHYKRWKIAKVLQDEKAVYLKILQDKLDEAMKALIPQGEPDGASSSEVQAGSHDLDGELQGLRGH